MSTCLVTGGCGFVGSHLVQALAERGDRVRVLDNLSSGRTTNLGPLAGSVELIEGDVADAACVARAMQGVEVVFHLAALASVPRSIKAPQATHHACVTGTLTVLDQARQAGVRRLIYAASSSAYGNSPWAAKRESDPVSPLSPYAAAKLAGEAYCQAFYHSYGLETVALRYFNVFGPRQDPNGAYAAVIPRFITAMLAGQRPVIYGDGHQSRDFTYVSNVVAGNLAAAEVSNVGGKVFNVASGRSYSLLALVESIGSLLGVAIEPQWEPARPGDVRDSLADISLAERELGYAPAVSFAEGLARTVAYYRDGH